MRFAIHASMAAILLTSSSAFALCSSTGTVTVASTIAVTSTTYDGGCKTFNATSALGDGSQNEGQKPYFKVTSGTLKNVILGKNGADGVYLYGNSTVDNITWTDVGEDAMTVMSSGTATLKNFKGTAAADKFLQMNAAGTWNVSNGTINGSSKSFRQNGGTTFKTAVTFTSVNQSNVTEAVFRTDSSTSTARWASGTGSNVLSVCRGYASGKCTVGSGVTGYTRLNY